MKYLYKYTPEIILVIYILAFLGFKSPGLAIDRVIDGDGKGYYAYLPAIFIYKDLQFSFTDKIDYQYYTGKPVPGDFRNNYGSRKVDKFFPGMAVVWLPFFLFAHAMARLELFPMDGYSLPYQYCIALSALLFLWLGLRWLSKLLKKFGSDDRTAAFITVVIALGTNLLYYTVIEPSMTHVYSFALIAAFAYTTFKLFHEYRPKLFVKSLLLLVLIFLIRPSNLLVLVLVPFLAGSMETFRSTVSRVVSERKALIRGVIQAMILLSVPFVLWYLQTGSPLVYSYGKEKLNLLHPHMLNILFSFNRGWFIYTPLALITLVGFVPLFRQNRFRFYLLAAFMALFVFAASCWWMWSYNSQCGQRVFIDIYIVTAMLLLFFYRDFQNAMARRIVSSGIILLVALNLLQFFQFSEKVFPAYPITGAIYRDSFFSLSPKARVFIPADAIAGKRSLENDMEANRGSLWMNQVTRSEMAAHLGKWSSLVNKKIPYSVGPETRFDSLFTTRNRMILVHGWILAPTAVSGITLVVDYQSEGKSVSYNQVTLDRFVSAKKWVMAEAGITVPANLPPNSTVKIYFYNPSAYYTFFIDDLTVDFLSLKDDPALRETDGVIMAR
ncbi:MAG: hypothetical protein WCK34_12435 [Bacteroidota bacterium]